MPGIASGELNLRATFERRLPGVGSRGEATGGWYTVAKVSAKLEPLGANEIELARERVGTATARLIIRRPYHWTPTPRDRVTVDGETYYLYAARLDESRANMVCGLAETLPKS